jgi:hypothetical protein
MKNFVVLSEENGSAWCSGVDHFHPPPVHLILEADPLRHPTPAIVNRKLFNKLGHDNNQFLNGLLAEW